MVGVCLPSPCYCCPLLPVLLALEGFPPVAVAASSVPRKSRDRDGDDVDNLDWKRRV